MIKANSTRAQGANGSKVTDSSVSSRHVKKHELIPLFPVEKIARGFAPHPTSERVPSAPPQNENIEENFEVNTNERIESKSN